MGLPEIIGVIIAILGWGIGYVSSSRINLNNKKKEMRIQYLIETYTILSDACNRHELSPKIEIAISNINLFGTEEQIELAHAFVQQLASTKQATYDTLLLKLRDDLRNELNLSKLKKQKKLLHLRITR